MIFIMIARCALLMAFALVLADTAYGIVRAPTKDDLRNAYYNRWI